MEASDYFMIRVQRAGVVAAPAFAGMVERLATGEKRSFQSGDELLRLVADWPGAVANMPTGATAGNAAPSHLSSSHQEEHPEE